MMIMTMIYNDYDNDSVTITITIIHMILCNRHTNMIPMSYI